MSVRRVRIVILCEDRQHEAFARRFLEGMGYNKRELRPEKSPGGAADQYVREMFPKELNAYRQRKPKAASALIAMVDADRREVQERIGEFKRECQSQGIPFRANDDAVVIAVPKRNIETWIHHLMGEQVNETDAYPKLDRERECQEAVNSLVQWCRSKRQSQDVPPSLAAACQEYNERMARFA